MNQYKKITISFLPSDSDLWNFIESRKKACNVSEYIRSLIRKDMTDDTIVQNDEKVIEKILQLLTNSEPIFSNEDRSNMELVPVSEEAKNTINNLF